MEKGDGEGHDTGRRGEQVRGQERDFLLIQRILLNINDCRYLARLLVSVDCVEYAGESVQRTFIEHSTLVYSKMFEVTSTFQSRNVTSS